MAEQGQFMTTLRFLARSGWRIAVLVVGGVVLLAGLVMMVTPGPGILLIAAGLGILATEFAWARSLRDKALETAKRGARRIRGKSEDSVDPNTG
jgi:uncharacterized protein (TIGR02611 family)